MGMKIMSNDLRSSCRALLLQSYDNGGGEEIEVEWKYPNDWLSLPKAGERECILLIRPSENRKKIAIVLQTYYDVADYPDYYVNIDWGDGVNDTFNNTQITYTMTCEHEYSNDNIGSYLLVKIQATSVYDPEGEGKRIETGINGFSTSTTGYIWNALAVSVGKHMPVVESYRSLNAVYVRFEMTDINELSVDSTYSSREPYTGYYRNLFAVFVGNLTKRIDFTGSPEIFGSVYSSSGWTNLRVIQGTDSIKKIHPTVINRLNGNNTLEKFIFPSLEEMPDGFLQYTNGLRIVYTPKCNKVGNGALSGNFSLQTVTVAKNCDISEYALQSNYQYVEIVEE